MPITFHNADIKFKLAGKAALKSFIANRVLKLSGQKAHLTYVFCSDEYLLDMNRRFLNHDYYTDIITFPIGENEKLVAAEIYISIDRVKDNAAKLKVAFEDELLRVVLHGVLHLLGYKDKTRAQKAAMRKAEEEWIEKFKGL